MNTISVYDFDIGGVYSVTAIATTYYYPKSNVDHCLHLSCSLTAVIGRTAISLNHLSRPTRCTRYINQSSFILIATRTDVYKFSFFPRTVNDWNSAPAKVRLKLSSPSDESLELFDWAMTPQRKRATPISGYWTEELKDRKSKQYSTVLGQQTGLTGVWNTVWRRKRGCQTFRTIDYSYHRRFVPLVDFSYHGRFVPWIVRTIRGLFVPFVPWTFRTILGLFVPLFEFYMF